MNRKILPRFFLTILLCIAGSFLLPVYAEAADNISEAEAYTEAYASPSKRYEAQSDTEAANKPGGQADAEAADKPEGQANAEASDKPEGQTDVEGSQEALATEDGTPDSQQQIITSVTDVSYLVGYAIPVGTDWDEFFASYFNDNLWQNSVTCETADGYTVNAHVTWSNPQPNTSVTQTITLTGTVTLPDNAVLADGVRVSKVHCTVSIQSADSPSLDSWYMNYGTITFPWITDGVTERNAVVMYRQDGSGWSTSNYFYCDDQAVYLNINGLSLGSYYEIQVVWDDGSTNVFSFTYDGSVSTNSLLGGDRDGGDAGGSGPSDVHQLPPDAGAQGNPDSQDNPGSEDTQSPQGDSGNQGSSDSSQNPQTDSDGQNDSVAQDDSGSQPQADSSSEPEPQTRPNAGYQTPSASGAESSETETSGNSSSASDSSSQSISGSDTQSDSDSQSASGSSTTSGSDNSDDGGNSDGNGSNSSPESDSNSADNNGSGSGDSSSAGNGSNSSGSSSGSGSDSSSSAGNNSSGSSSDSASGSDASGTDGSTGLDDTFMETITDTHSLISGTRLALMRQNGSVRFSKQGITVTLADAALDTLDITDDSQFYIEIRDTENGFSITVELDGQSVTELPGTVVMLPCDAPDDGNVLTLKDSDGSTITGSYDDASGTATFTVQHSGVYTLTETQSDDGAAVADDASSDSDGSSGTSAGSGSDSDGSFDTSVVSGSDSAASATANSDSGSGKTISQLKIRASATAATVLVVILAAIFLIPLFTGIPYPLRHGAKLFGRISQAIQHKSHYGRNIHPLRHKNQSTGS